MNIDLEFIYENNNTYIKIIWLTDYKKNKYSDNWECVSNDIVYDYEINWLDKKNKAIDVSFKANEIKTENRIKEKIKNIKFKNDTKLEEIKEFENTQITKLNDISLSKEVYKEWNNYYRAIYIVENNQYLPISKIYFDNHWKIDEEKTEKELGENKVKILW
jgi:hypothetical protein